MERDTEQKAIVALSDSERAGPLKREGKMFPHTNRPLQKRFLRNSPRKRLPEIFNRSAYAQHFHEWKKKKEGKGEIKPSTCACTTVVVVEGRRNKKKEKKWRIVVKLRRKQRSRWNNAMFHARRLTFPRNNEVNKKNSYILNGNALYSPG